MEVLKSSNHDLLSPVWRPIPLVVAHAFAIALFLSYFLPTGREIWRYSDQAVFFLLNGSLTDAGLWEQMWAWANTRFCDVLGGLLILILLVYPVSGFRSDQLQSALFLFISMVLCLLVLRSGFHFFCNWLELRVASPSLVLSPAIRLSEIFPEIPLKDASGSSFPGDHASVLFAWTGFVLVSRRCWASCLAGCIPLLLVLPRLFSGAHWLSDQLVGGLVVAIPVVAWTYYSPCVGFLARLMTKGAHPVINRLSRWPWFRNQKFFLDSPINAPVATDRASSTHAIHLH